MDNSNQSESFMINFLIKKGVIKDEKTGNILLTTFAIVSIIISGYVIKSILFPAPVVTETVTPAPASAESTDSDSDMSEDTSL